ncbi:SubName: Full=Uncharacterized protein {ECO:0000313/EMBL:CCA71835.1} [Serendipita indica DSM 11827]|nr:SubName: Full=Uncharacterized protein {ECO:0000313/EMBL:CCA71835.1} [Serendipita indica DSM 11827]
MALQAPERRGKSLQDDLERAFALSRADKRLGDYFPSVENSSHAWHFDGSEHTGGGFDTDAYAYKSRGDLKRDWEVSVVQWARERDQADKGWRAEDAGRGGSRELDDRKMKTIWAIDDADVQEAKKSVEEAWAREQRELEGIAPPSKKHRHSSSVPALPTPVDARRLNESYVRPQLHDADPTARTSAWVGGKGDHAGVRDYYGDPTEPNEVRTMEIFKEEMRRKAREGDAYSKRQSKDDAPVRRRSTHTSRAPTLPPKDGEAEAEDEEPEYIESPKSLMQTMSIETTSRRGPSRASARSDPKSERRSKGRSNSRVESRSDARSDVRSLGSEPDSEHVRSIPSEPDSEHVRSIPSEASSEHIPRPDFKARISMFSAAESIPLTIPPSLPSKDSGRGSPDSMETESRRSERSDVEDGPEPIHIFSPGPEEASTKVRTRPSSSMSRQMSPKKSEKVPSIKQRPMSFHVMASESQVNLKGQDIASLKSKEVASLNREASFKTKEAASLHRDTSFKTRETASLNLIQTAGNRRCQRSDQPNYLREMSFTVPGMFSRSAVRINDQVEAVSEGHRSQRAEEVGEDGTEEPPTPKQRPRSMSRRPTHPAIASLRSSGNPPNVDKSLPGTPYTMTHSVVTEPEFDPDALEDDQKTRTSYYRQKGESRETLPPGYSSGSKTPRGSMFKQPPGSYSTLQDPLKSTTSLASGKSAKTSSTGAMGDVEADVVENTLRNAERRPSKKRRPKPEGSQASSDGSGSTIKASVHSRSQSSTSDDARQTQEQGSSQRHHSLRRTKGLHAGTSHTQIVYSDSDSFNEGNLVHPPPEEEGRLNKIFSGQMEGGQYVTMPEHSDARAVEPNSAHTFGLPTGTTATFREMQDSRPLQDSRNNSRVSLPSRPISGVPSMRSTRVSTLRASLRSPLPGISERDTTSELSFHGDDVNPSGSFVGNQYYIPSIPSEEVLHVEAEEVDVGPMAGMTPEWRADLWSRIAWDAAAIGRGSGSPSEQSQSRPRYDHLGAMSAAVDLELSPDNTGSGKKSSISSLGVELRENFTVPHPARSYQGQDGGSRSSLPLSPLGEGVSPQGSGGDGMGMSYQGSQQSLPLSPGANAGGHSSGMEEPYLSAGVYGIPRPHPSTQEFYSSGQSKNLHSVGELVHWNEDSEVGMAGVGAHGIRAAVSYKEPPPPSESDFTD